MRFYKIISLLFLLSFSLLQNACLAERAASQVIKDAPQDVLVGTDIKLLKNFKISSDFHSGHYVAEMGGANLSIDIDSNDKSLVIKRTFQEPGLPVVSKSYDIKNTGKSFVETNTLLVIPVNTGVLLLEKKSGNPGIPMDIWVFYTKK